MREASGPAVLRRAAPALAGLLLGLLALGPALGPGFVLRYDMVFVPDPPIMPPQGGFPRAVPSDLAVALASLLVPSDVVQKAVLLGVFVLAATGAAALVPSRRTAARLAAAVFYAWNLYLAQRLLLGQWALLLGVAGLPWAVRAAAAGRTGRTRVALLPAAMGGFQATLVSALAVLPVAASRSARAAAATLAVLAGVSLPWLVPAVLSEARTDPAGVDAFAARADGPFGTVGSLLSLGGIWNAGAGVPGQGSWWLAAARLALAAVALWGFWRARHDLPGWTGLAVAAAAGLGVACLGTFGPGRELLRGLVGLWSGFGPLRDGQVFLAPLALAQAVGFGRFVGAVSGPGAVRALGVAVPVLVLPTFALGAFGRLAAVPYPQEWREVQRLVDADPARGALLSLPWGAHRAFAWNGGRVVLDPAVKLFDRRVIWDDALTVGVPGGGVIRVDGEDPVARGLGPALTSGTAPLTGTLLRAGVSHVLIGRPYDRDYLARLPGATRLFAGRDLVLVRL